MQTKSLVRDYTG